MRRGERPESGMHNAQPGHRRRAASSCWSATLAAIYLVSQFLRNSVGVIAPDLAAEIGLNAGEIGLLSSAFFFAFAAAQIPLGVALDRYGPKRCMLVCAAIAFVGTLAFAAAATPAGLVAARVLMGLGSSCYLMAPLALYARRFPPERFTLLAGIQIGDRHGRHAARDRAARLGERRDRLARDLLVVAGSWSSARRWWRSWCARTAPTRGAARQRDPAREPARRAARSRACARSCRSS